MFTDGQSVVEYMVLFAIVAAFTLLSVCSLFPPLRQSCQIAFQGAMEEILECE